MIIIPLKWEKVMDEHRGRFLRRKWEAVTPMGLLYEIWDCDKLEWETQEIAGDPDQRYSLTLQGRRCRLLTERFATRWRAEIVAEKDFQHRARSCIITNPSQE